MKQEQDRLCADDYLRHMKRFYYEMNHDFDPDIWVNDAWSMHHDDPHFHNSIELLYVEEGMLHVRLNGVEYDVREGQFIAISSLVIHELDTIGNTRRCVLIVPHLALGADTVKLLDGKAFDQCVQTDDGTMNGLMQTLRRVRFREGIFSDLCNAEIAKELIRSLCRSMILLAITSCGLVEQSRKCPLAIRTMQYLHLHFREPIRIPELARTMLTSQQTLSDEFRRAFGMTVNAYLNHLRARDVYANLREDPEMGLCKAAELSGFGSVRSLLRAYRKEFGGTPSEKR